MKAIQISHYTQDLDFQYTNIPKPQIKPNEILIKGKYAGVDPHLILAMTGKVKLFDHYDFPLTLGNELAGVVAEVGAAVSDFQVGDKVYTMPPLNTMGAFAEYLAVEAQYVAKMPENLSFQEAAAIPLSALTIRQAFDILRPLPDKRLFIPGGTGGFGQIAVPYAKALGLRVTVSGGPVARATATYLGADQFINYETTDYSDILQDYDYVIDTRGADEFKKELAILYFGGHLLSLNAGPNARFGQRHRASFSAGKRFIFRLAGSSFDRQAKKQGETYDFLYVAPSGQQLRELTPYFEQSQIKPVIDTVYPFDQAKTAIDRVKVGHNQGKILLDLEADLDTNS
ncbi:MAG: NADP-dependent oxidoreductase [Lactobacillus sp.]|jgi:NADPH:quinone reductase-like Zn-dependent oxidoreductase|nr:NADP-dependent oxidoreductase [Lactobacillus sp.]